MIFSDKGKLFVRMGRKVTGASRVSLVNSISYWDSRATEGQVAYFYFRRNSIKECSC